MLEELFGNVLFGYRLMRHLGTVFGEWVVVPDAGVAEVLINDPRMVLIPTAEVGEPLVPATMTCIDHWRVRNDGSSRLSVRADVARRAEPRAWRDRLAIVMSEAGFVNYPHEWWHFSYGDQYWAWRTGALAALYGSAEPQVPKTV